MDVDWTDDEPTRRGLTLGRERLLAIAAAFVVLSGAGIAMTRLGHAAGGSNVPTARTTGAAAIPVTVRVPGTPAREVGATRPVVGATAARTDKVAAFDFPSSGATPAAAGSLVQVRQAATDTAADLGGASARAGVRIGHVALLGGRVVIDGADLTARAGVHHGVAQGGLTLASGVHVTIDGRVVRLAPNRIVVLRGIGTLTLDEQAVVAAAPTGDGQSGPRRRDVGAIAHLRLTSPWNGLPAGTEVEVGRVEAGVRIGKVTPASAAATTAGAAQPSVPTAVPGLAVTAGSLAGGTTGTEVAGPGTHRVQAGSPRPGDTTIPRASTAVRAEATGGDASTGNLQGYVFPVLGQANFTDSFGAFRADVAIGHQGVDVFAAEGTPIVAVADGVLDRVGWNSIGGYRFWLFDKYGNGFYHAHLSAFAPLAVDGATVHAGDVIGFVGHTGDAQGTPNHLHFEVHPGDGAATDPFPFLTAWKHGLPVALGTIAGATGESLDQSGVGPTRLPSVSVLGVSDIATNSGLGDAPYSSVAPATRPITQEDAAVPSDASLRAAIAGGGTAAAPAKP